VLGISDVISYEGVSLAELEQSFRDALESYFLGCKEVGKEPEKPEEGLEDAYLAEATLIRIRMGQEVIIPGDVVNRIILEKKSRICAWREHMGLTQEEVAKRLGVNRPAFTQMEAKGANVSQDTLKKVALALGVEWEQLRD
jgi:DNA-binding XRE family transcriptional regulator